VNTTLPSPRPGKGRLRRLEARFLKPHRRTIALALCGMLLQSVLLLPIPVLQGRIIDVLIGQSQPATEAGAATAGAATAGAATLWLIAAALAVTVVCFAARTALIWRNAAAMGRVALEVIRDLTGALHSKLQRLPISYYDREQTGRLMARITSDVGSLLIFLNSASLQLVCDLILAAGISMTLLILQWRLALIAFAILPLYVLSYRLFAARNHELSREGRAQIAALYALLSERLSAVRVVRSFSRENGELGELDERLAAYRDVSWRTLLGNAWQGALAVFVSGMGTVATLAAGALFVGQSQMSVGELLTFYVLLTQLYNPIVRLAQFQAVVAATRAAVERIAEAFDEPETLLDLPNARPLTEVQGTLAFRDVTFGYARGAAVLQQINLEIKAGTKVGILGASGSGKSTLLALAPRLYEVPAGQGSVLFDGHDIRELRMRDLRRAVALVPQQALLFEGTIRSNLLYGRPDAPPELVKRVLEVADLADLVAALPRGLDTPVGERGYSLSGGQRQRLALARALVTEPAVLLLDDATSALDAETEARIQQALDAFLPGRTCLIVSHKVSSVQNADWIVVLDQGRIAEQGTHAELLLRGGLYAEIHRMQTSRLKPRRGQAALSA
jgi:ABC-type multidrug transport system fused ATPase/permease subunit